MYIREREREREIERGERESVFCVNLHSSANGHWSARKERPAKRTICVPCSSGTPCPASGVHRLANPFTICTFEVLVVAANSGACSMADFRAAIICVVHTCHRHYRTKIGL